MNNAYPYIAGGIITLTALALAIFGSPALGLAFGFGVTLVLFFILAHLIEEERESQKAFEEIMDSIGRDIVDL